MGLRFGHSGEHCFELEGPGVDGFGGLLAGEWLCSSGFDSVADVVGVELGCCHLPAVPSVHD